MGFEESCLYDRTVNNEGSTYCIYIQSDVTELDCRECPYYQRRFNSE